MKGPEDDEILRHTVDFVSFSYYASRCAAADMNAGNTSEANVVKSLRNPHIEVSEWGWGIDPWAFASPSTPCTIATRSPSSWWKTAWGAVDEVNELGEIEDDYRIAYLRAHIEAMGTPSRTACP